MAELTIKSEDRGSIQWFELHGRVNTTTAEDFDREMTKALKSGSRVTVNMYNVTLLTSVGIRVILKTYKLCTSAGGKFLIEKPSTAVQNVLGLSALERMLQ